MSNNAYVTLERRHSDKKNVDYDVLILKIGDRTIELFPGNKSSEIEFSLMILEINKERGKN